VAETLLCFNSGERFLTMSETGRAVIWTVSPHGGLVADPSANPPWTEEDVSQLLREAVGGDEDARKLVRSLAGLAPGGHEERAWQIENDETTVMTPVGEDKAMPHG
jgi:hypothetical protein